MNKPFDSSHPLTSKTQNLKRLTPDQIRRIDELLASVGEYGEVHLIIQKGQLRYINRVESYKAWNGVEK